jgi:hypothetical protein|nr:MAG TPA: hypothetical protein [Caudoviricetes sp.]
MKCIELSERIKLNARCNEITGNDLPEPIKRSSIDLIRKAVRLASQGIIAVIEDNSRRPEQSSVADESMRDWDSHKEH